MEPVSPEVLKEYARQLILVLDLLGTFVFALSGALAGVRRRLDLFGVFVVSFAAGSLGGVIRDLLIGSIPPAAINDWRYTAAALLAAITAFLWHPSIDKRRGNVRVLDAAGLAVFAVSGTQKSIDFGLNLIIAPMLGMLTGIGGGIVRDLLVGEVPFVLRAELYALAALAGAAVIVIGHLLGLSPTLTTAAGAALCFGLRYLAIRRDWNLPIAGHRIRKAAESGSAVNERTGDS